MFDIRNFLWRLIPVSSWRRAARRRLGEDLIVREYVTTLRAKLAGISRRAGKIEILCLGSSHADYGFRPDAFPGNAFNFGAASQDLRTSAELAKRLVPTLPHLRKIVMFFSVFSPGSCLAKTKESFRSVVYEELLHVPVPESCSLEEKECARVRKICRRERGEDSHTDAFGFNASMPGFDIPAEERVRTHLRENLREPDQMSHLEKMISETGGGMKYLSSFLPRERTTAQRSRRNRNSSASSSPYENGEADSASRTFSTMPIFPPRTSRTRII